MDNGGLALNTATGIKGAYRDLFHLEAPVTSEIILAVCANGVSGVYGTQNYLYNPQSYGKGRGPVRPFVNTCQKLDGTPFSAETGYETKSFVEEMDDRDLRLAQTIRGVDFKRAGITGGTEKTSCNR